MLFFASNFCLAQTSNWATTIGGAGGNGCTHLAVVPTGLVVGGTFQQSITLGGQQWNSEGGADIFLIWYDEQGTTLQQLLIGNAINNELGGLVADQHGSIYITGTFSGHLTLGSFHLESHTISYFITKINANGQVVWAELLFGSSVNKVTDIQLDYTENHLLLTGYYNDSLQLQNQYLYTAETTNFFVLRQRIDGQLDWMQDAPYAFYAEGKSVVGLADERIWVAVEFRNKLTMPQDSFYISVVHTDILLAALDCNGQWQSAKRWGGVFNDRPKKLLRTENGRSFWMIGEFVGTCYFDEGTPLVTAFRFYDTFWVKVDATGVAGQRGQTNTIANTYVEDGLLLKDQLKIAGYFQDSLQGPNQVHIAIGGYDGYELEIDTITAQATALRQFGVGGYDNIKSLAITNNGLALAGTFQGQLEVADQMLNAIGFTDGWLAWEATGSLLTDKPSSNVPKLLALTIIPNPSKRQFQIQLKETQALHWELYNLNGQRVLDGAEYQVDASGLASGTYSLQVYTEKGAGVVIIILE